MKYLVAALLIGVPISAQAGKCPLVMIILDRSGSMNSPPSGAGGPTKMVIAKDAITKMVQAYGKRLPFGFTTFQQGACVIGPTDGIDLLVKPAPKTGMQILTQVAAVVTAGATNTGTAVQKVAIDPSMKDDTRPGSYIILVTDGGPTCSDDPNYTTREIQSAAMKGIKTFVIGFGMLSGTDSANMDTFAEAGGVPCSPAVCGGKKYYAAESAAALNAALDAITDQISGEFGSICDDSCYATGCPNVGEICVSNECRPDPCANVTTCAPGDYCYSDGSSPGTCARSCQSPCPQGQLCTTQGTCVNDPCATVSCPSGQVCSSGGSCVAEQCGPSKPCDDGLPCIKGQCRHDTCGHVRCPMGTQCVGGTGACVAISDPNGAADGGVGGGGGGRNRGGGGCDVASSPSGGIALAALLLLASAIGLRARRRRTSIER